MLGVRELGLKQRQDGKGDTISLLDHRVQMSWKLSSGEAEAKHEGSASSYSINNILTAMVGQALLPTEPPSCLGGLGKGFQYNIQGYSTL